VQRRFVVIGAVVAAVVVAAVVAALLLASGGDDEATPGGTHLAGADETRALLRGIPQDDIAIGPPDAPVTLVEFADLQCPFCASWATDAFPDVVEEYVRPGKLRIEFRGLAFIGDDSEKALRAALAAGQQDRLWHVVELLYRNQGAENSGWVTDELLDAVGRAAGLDVDGQLAAAERLARANAIQSTPSFLVGRTGGTLRRVDVVSLDAGGITPAIDRALSG
jgi:protein-disulfide isomerase